MISRCSGLSLESGKDKKEETTRRGTKMTRVKAWLRVKQVKMVERRAWLVHEAVEAAVNK